jgi:hypothetical protein
MRSGLPCISRLLAAGVNSSFHALVAPSSHSVQKTSIPPLLLIPLSRIWHRFRNPHLNVNHMTLSAGFARTLRSFAMLPVRTRNMGPLMVVIADVHGFADF